jgi:hypothetical protein
LREFARNWMHRKEGNPDEHLNVVNAWLHDVPVGPSLLNLAKTLIVRLEGIRIEIKLAPGASPPHIVPNQETALRVHTPEEVHVLTKGS